MASEEYKGAISEYPIAEEILIKNRIMISLFMQKFTKIINKIY